MDMDCPIGCTIFDASSVDSFLPIMLERGIMLNLNWGIGANR